MNRRKLLLYMLLVTFVAWIGFLIWQTRDAHAIIVSRSQMSVASIAILADVTETEEGLPSKVVARFEALDATDDAKLPKDGKLEVLNLADCRGFRKPGTYLLLLNKLGESFMVVTPPKSPGYESLQRPIIYLWTPEVRQQFEQFRR